MSLILTFFLLLAVPVFFLGKADMSEARPGPALRAIPDSPGVRALPPTTVPRLPDPQE